MERLQAEIARKKAERRAARAVLGEGAGKYLTRGEREAALATIGAKRPHHASTSSSSTPNPNAGESIAAKKPRIEEKRDGGEEEEELGGGGGEKEGGGEREGVSTTTTTTTTTESGRSMGGGGGGGEGGGEETGGGGEEVVGGKSGGRGEEAKSGRSGTEAKSGRSGTEAKSGRSGAEVVSARSGTADTEPSTTTTTPTTSTSSSSSSLFPLSLVCGSGGEVVWQDFEGKEHGDLAWGATVASRETAMELGDIGGRGDASFPPVREAVLSAPMPPPSRPLGDGKFVSRFFRGLLEEWKKDLEARPAELRHSALGRAQEKEYGSVRNALKPLFHDIKRERVTPELLEHVKRIALLLQRREFRRAVDQYFQLAIGNSPWPMGITAAGIHQRSAGGKIAAESIAHILNDEATKEQVVAVRQLITYAQRRFPNEQPSRRVAYAPKPGARK